MNVFFNGMGSRFIPDEDLVPAMGSYASSPNDSQPRALRGAVIGIVDVFVTVGAHEHRQQSEVRHAWV